MDNLSITLLILNQLIVIKTIQDYDVYVDDIFSMSEEKKHLITTLIHKGCVVIAESNKRLIVTNTGVRLLNLTKDMLNNCPEKLLAKVEKTIKKLNIFERELVNELRT